MSSSSPSPASEAELIAEATRGISLVLNDELSAARKLLSARPASCFHLVGLGLISFLVSALGVEDKELSQALDLLTKAETAAGKGKGRAESHAAGHWWPKATEYDVLVADTVIAQALVHILTESYLEFIKAVYKLNRAFKLFSSIYKTVFTHGVKESDSVEDVISLLNATYMSAKLNPSTKHDKHGWPFSSQSKRKALSLEMRSSSHSDLKAARPDLLVQLSATAPVTPMEATTPTDVKHISSEMATMIDRRLSLTHIKPNWLNDEVAQMVIGGSAFGHGLFELVFAMLPPKLRKLTSWFGYSYGNRTIALSLLSVASMGTDVHASFASLVLLTYYGIVLLLSGWQANRKLVLRQCRQILDHVKTRLPEGSLWLLNQAKIDRMEGDAEKAAETLETALARDTDFKQGQTVLKFELAWCEVSLLQYRKAAESWLKMRELNSWSHATYTIIAAGCFLHVLNEDDTLHDKLDKLITTELPGMLGKKRLMGQPPPSEAFASARLEFWAKKRDRWSAQGRKGHSGQLRSYEVIRIAPVDELGLQWQTFVHIPPESAEKLIKMLSGLSPSPVASATALLTAGSGDKVDLDTSEELTLRATLLGPLYRKVGDFASSASFLDAVISRGSSHLDDGHTYLIPVAHFESAILECTLAESETASLADTGEALQIWHRRLKAAEKHLDEVFKQGTFLMQSRTESRAQMLRTEIDSKRETLALTRS